MASLSEKEKQNALNEIRILASIQYISLFVTRYRNPNIVSYKESFFEDASSTLCIVMDLADAGDL
jgi:NIMA (never in mitosis gene a)-related kinase